MIKYLGLGDYLTIAELILGIDGELLANGVGIGLADSALAAPQASFDGIEFYPELEQHSCLPLEHLVKNHPLRDGNKRTAYATMWMFITINGSTWTLEDPNAIVPTIIRVASGEISTEEITEWVASNIKQ